MKELVQQCVVSNIFLDVFAPERDELASEDSLKVIENAFRLTDEELSSRVSRAIRLSAKASAEIEAAFPGI